MSKTSLILFWVFWLLDVLLALLGHREFINAMFGRYASPTLKLSAVVIILLMLMVFILWISLYFKNHERGSLALGIAAIPIIPTLCYLLWMGMILIMGRNTNWQ
jgi:hypothetical protein